MFLKTHFEEINTVLDVQLIENSVELAVRLVENEEQFEFEFGEVYEVTKDFKAYMDSYTVTPTVNGLTLETAEKLMKDDVTIRPIPFFDASNPSGGITIYIANEV